MTDTNNVPAVYTALASIINNLAVEKNGTLPGNMGGKPYITASDAAAEVKRQFVENNLIFIPNEEVIKQEIITFKDRLNIAVLVTGTYTIISTVDGSSVTVSGTGDGLATGTAVASNIASTNAFKNALLRTFLITEQSVEDASKQGVSDSGTSSPTAQKLDRARTPASQPARPPAPAKGDELAGLKAKIRQYIGSDDARKNAVNDKMAALKAEGAAGIELHKTLIEELGIS